MRPIHIFFLLPLVFMGFTLPPGNKYVVQRGEVHFKSDAALELIEASSMQLKGVMDMEERTFAFSVDIGIFEGFNCWLQRQQFNENYLESSQYKVATYIGKIIEEDDITRDGSYSIRTKGKLTVHGIAKERIIKSEVTTRDGVISVHSNFTLLLDEHGITIPRIVKQNIAEEIAVEVTADFSEVKD